MELYDPALIRVFFYPRGDRQSEALWQAMTSAPPGLSSSARQRRLAADGATLLQVILERRGEWPPTVWQELAEEMGRWLGKSSEAPPGHPWGASLVYLGAAVAGHYEEQRLLREGLGLAAGSLTTAHLPAGRLWLISPPEMQEAGNLVATYACIHAPGQESRRRAEDLLWEEGAPFLRAELYLHRALHALRQFGQDRRAGLWAAMDRTEAAAVNAMARPGDSEAWAALQRACLSVVQGLAMLNRRHNLLRSSAYLYRQISSKLCPDEGTVFTWFGERLKEVSVQWSYDLERGDRAIVLAQTALAAFSSASQAAASAETTSARWAAGRLVRLPWIVYLAAAAAVALSLVDDSWTIVLVRAGVVLLLLLVAWGWLVIRERWRRNRP